LQAVVTREISVYGSCGSAGEYAEAIAAIGEGTINVRPLLSAVASLQEGADWFHRLYRNDGGLLKVILRPRNDT
jgi:L-iditol 2-dehydrogenase